MFAKSAAFYDALYGWKDYAREAQILHAVIQEHKRGTSDTLLDVACGTGLHAAHLSEHYAVEGLDLDESMLAVARQRLPAIKFHRGDMVDFNLNRSFDIVTCLFSSIGYVRTLPRLRQAAAALARHLCPGGLLVVEPWLTPEVYRAGQAHALFIDQPELKICRMNVSTVDNGISILDFHYLVATPLRVEHFTERHELGLFTPDEYQTAFADAGLKVTYDAQGLMGRGLYLGLRPVSE